MIRRRIIFLYAIFAGIGLVAAAYSATRYLALDEQPLQHAATSSVPYIVEEFASGLEVPWSIVWTSPERMLVTERPGRIRVILNGVLQSEPLATFADVSTGGEQGLMGLVVDPEHARNGYLYACYTRRSGGGQLVDTVIRLIDRGGAAEVDGTVLDHIRAAAFHAGCRLAFGPDGKLYVTTGDATERTLAQDTSSLVGKILRVNPDGTVPEDNPFPGSSVWSYGHRNPQGIAWHPESGALYETEHGPSVNDGPAGGDEVNRIVRGGNYGWPLVSHERTREGTAAPLRVFTPAEAPASAAFYSGAALPQFKNDLFFGALRGQGLVRMTIDPGDPDRILNVEKLPEVRYGRIRAVAEGPDGFLYFSTSNRDGRGSPAAGDDRIFRIRPK